MSSSTSPLKLKTGLFTTMHRKLPSFSFSSEPDSIDGSQQPSERKSRSFLSKLSGAGRSRSPGLYSGRSSRRTGGSGSNSRSSSVERESSALSDAESDSDGGALSASERYGPSTSRRYSGTAYESAGEETASEHEYSEAEFSDDDEELPADEMDEVVLANTEANAGSRTAADFLLAQPATGEVLEDGPNLIKSPASPFAMSSTSTGVRQPRRRKSTMKEEFSLNASRPMYERNRCTITLTHGDPESYLQDSNENGKNRRKGKVYVVASDLSEESYYAIEWAIGTVLRNGDELLFITVMETDSKLDPEDNASSADKSSKIRNQQERQTRVLQLSREATALLERTRLHVSVECQAIHAKNARHMLIDLIDYIEPTLVIIGSRGLGKLKGVILGSMSHYLIQKSSSPVMVTRRRLKPVRRPRRPISDLQRQPRVSGLADATIDVESHAGMVPPTGSAEERAQQEQQKAEAEETDTEGPATAK